MQRVLRRLLRRHPGPASAAVGPVDLSWFDAAATRVSQEARGAAAETCRMLAPLFGCSHREVKVVADAERGSLLLEFRDGVSWRFAVTDVDAAEQLAASARLGGLVLLLSSREPGMVRIHGVWERFSYVLYGIPVRDVLAT